MILTLKTNEANPNSIQHSNDHTQWKEMWFSRAQSNLRSLSNILLRKAS